MSEIINQKDSDLLTKEEVMNLLRIKQDITLFYKKNFKIIKREDEYCFLKSEIEKFLGTDLNEPFLTHAEASEYLGITEKELFVCINHKTIPYYSFSVDQSKMGSTREYGKGRRRLFKKSDLSQYQESGNIFLIFNYPSTVNAYKWMRDMFLYLLDIEQKSEFISFLSTRQKEVITEILNGNTLDGIGQKFGLTRERIRQIFEKSKREIETKLKRRLSSVLSEHKSLKDRNRVLESTLASMRAHIPPKENELDSESISIRNILKIRPIDLDLSVRLLNCLKASDVKTFADLVSIPRADYLLQYRNFGKKSLREINEVMVRYRLHFGMDISKYGLVVSEEFKKWNSEAIERFKLKKNIS